MIHDNLDQRKRCQCEEKLVGVMLKNVRFAPPVRICTGNFQKNLHELDLHALEAGDKSNVDTAW